MQMIADEIREDQTHCLELKMDNAKEFCSVLKTVTFREGCTFHVTKTGIRIIVDDQHCEQANIYFEYPVFSSFVLREDVNFRVPIQELTEVLSMLDGNDVTLKMSYDGFGEPLRVTLASSEDDYIVQASIHTVNPEAVLDFDFNPEEIRAKIKIKPELFRDIIKGLDDTSHALSMRVCSRKFTIISQGDIGKISMNFPSHSELIEKIECTVDTSHSYRVLLIKRMAAALNLSSKVTLCIDVRGVLCVQLAIERPEQQQFFIEFFCVADTENPDDDE
ncbi:unnamed protein product [Auanema sp. JU1783]|nr:unnamed protein product [Auanema sp. JU1783]